jgi:hypothetical protein
MILLSELGDIIRQLAEKDRQLAEKDRQLAEKDVEISAQRYEFLKLKAFIRNKGLHREKLEELMKLITELGET